MDAEFILRRLEAEVPRYRFRYLDEAGLHAGIKEVLTSLRIPFEHEFIASAQDRFDFLLDGSVVIEAKVAGTLPDVLLQAKRYCAHERVKGVAVIGTSRWSVRVPLAMFDGKRIVFIDVQRRAF